MLRSRDKTIYVVCGGAVLFRAFENAREANRYITIASEIDSNTIYSVVKIKLEVKRKLSDKQLKTVKEVLHGKAHPQV